MALTRNGTAVDYATINGTLLNKVAVNGTAVWTYVAPTTSGWVTKSGSLFKLTSSTVSSPITGCAFYRSLGDASNVSTYSNLNLTDAYKGFDGNQNTYSSTFHKDYVCNGLMGEVTWSSPIKIISATCTYQNNVKAKDTQYLYLYGKKSDGTWAKIGTHSRYFSTQDDYLIFTPTIMSTDSVTEFYGVRIYCTGSNPTAGRAIYIKEIQVTQWQEKIPWVNKTGTLASSSVSGTFNPAWQTDDVVKTQTIALSTPTKITSVYLYSGTIRPDINGWCKGRVTLTGKTAAGTTVTLLNKYTDFDRNGKTVMLNNTNELVSLTWTWYTPDGTYRDYNVNQNGYVNAWQVQE